MFDIAPQLDCSGRILRLDATRVMGIVNVTPDSFSDGGAHATTEAAIAHALKLVDEGADLLDVGGESTRPGAQDVSVEEELRRTIPVIEALAQRVSIPISIDTSKPDVMRAAVAAGAGMINDVRALREEGALAAAAELGVPVLAGLSRKKTIGDLTGRDQPRDRVFGSVAAHLLAAQRGAAIVRVHDVSATLDALKVLHALAAVTLPRVEPKPGLRWPDDA